ncbi:hypothetical protein BLA24_20780 [Streptomyces cinnamoneus]|uniref:DUF2304 domain-containing protein n=1 Tax=Streptomyces cinnamoneus TaxID=53446 RepID=A0A2G1XGN3_STRCJ|nr:hypothetical protein [Streptomyces cinnamoneus]PHQ50387.1 hypothetical protein BLA24_20780 [Streptomyces cinnamoneus]PPT13176.1 hypothetical protein CYQ11_10000 [Streptomyces cinnamoneus]
MVISLSVVLLFGIILVVMVRSNKLKMGPALVAILFGFFLASTGMAPSINRLVSSVAETINNIKF